MQITVQRMIDTLLGRVVVVEGRVGDVDDKVDGLAGRSDVVEGRMVLLVRTWMG